ncbi:PREDICTED: bifunctional dihydrocamalexate synthase/camalexin synthase-like [Camelina sativa]|uniref:Bifunctional dihydrocamalexate synthase/camalexin synthase-like n=1 Tax=Camelina sativa TaxID=90675 RepID=A0ABM0ZDS9_CAMSA|nr:PREDICTED: bifunctional dihydrocamalexate synthase/camalexin synthase-like [Camelina sativa]
MSVFLCFLFLLPLILIFLNVFKPSKLNLPPSPKKLPIIGNLHQRGKLHPRNRRNLAEKYGPVALLQYGNVPVVVISSKEAAEEVLKIHDSECCNRPETAGTKITFYNFKDIGLAPFGDEWTALRKLSVVELFSVKKLQSFRNIREEENDLCIKKLSEFATTRTPVNLERTLFTLIGNIVCRIGYGINLYECEFVDENRIMELVHKSEKVIRATAFSDFFPGRIGRLVDWISGQERRLKNIFSEVDTFYQNILDEHLKPGRESSDIIDVMIDMKKKQEKDGDALKFTTDHLKGMISDILTAGVGGSSATVLWGITELIRNPKVMKKVQDEIRTKLGDKKERIKEEDLNQLHYFKLMVKELFRLHPSTPLLLPRQALSHFKVQGYDIPAKAQILVNVYAIGRDPNLWENANEFNPDRFLDSSIDYKGGNFEFIPFGSGRRICPGMTMGIILVELTLLNLLYFFNWGVSEKDVARENVTRDEDNLDFVQVLHP